MGETSFQKLYRMRRTVHGLPERFCDVALSMFAGIKTEIEQGHVSATSVQCLATSAACYGYRAADTAGIGCDDFIERFALVLAAA